MVLPGFVADPPAETLARALTGDNGRHVVSYQTEAGHFKARGLPTVDLRPRLHRPGPPARRVHHLRAARRRRGFVRRLIRRLAA